MTHTMLLAPQPFEMIGNGAKTIELRLYDEKRQRIRVGDVITFVHTEDGRRTLNAEVTALYVFDSFDALYRELPLLECGYTEADVKTASPRDMDAYYSEADQRKYGAVGIRLALL